MSRTKTTPQPEAPEKRPRYVLGSSPRLDLCPPLGLSATPTAVEIAVQECESAYSSMRLAGEQLRAANGELPRAEAIDTASDRSAVAAGRELPTERALPRAVEAAQLAERRADAATATYREKMHAYAQLVAHHREAWLIELRGVIQAGREEAREHLEKLAATLEGIAGEKLAATGLEQWPEAGTLINCRMREPTGRAAEAHRARARDDARASLQQLRRPESDVYALLALIERAINSDGPLS